MLVYIYLADKQQNHSTYKNSFFQKHFCIYSCRSFWEFILDYINEPLSMLLNAGAQGSHESAWGNLTTPTKLGTAYNALIKELFNTSTFNILTS